jgi:rhodanese-related sulfurtransferase
MAEVAEIEAAELKRRLDRGDRLSILDVREPEEIAIAAFPGALQVPMGDVPARLTELDPDDEWVIVCHHGIRSGHVAAHLARMGFERISNLIGGIDEWARVVDPSIPRY